MSTRQMARVRRLLVVVACGLTLETCAIQTVSTDQDLLQHFIMKSEMDPESTYDIFRFDLDVTGDGVPELFLSHSQFASSGFIDWLVYTKVGEGKYRQLDIVGFAYSLFRLSDDGTRFSAYYKGETGGIIVTYRVDSTGFHEESRRDDVLPESPEWKDFGTWQTKVGLKVLAADLNEVENNVLPKWREILTNTPVPGVGGLRGLVVVE